MSRPLCLSPTVIAKNCNYVAAFLTMSCPYHCSYCINEFGSPRKKERLMTASDWIRGLGRLTNLQRSEGEVPVTLQGGEPSIHPRFYEIINGLPERIRIDVLTNLCFDVQEMIDKVNPARLRRPAPYASIRVSYHPEQASLDELLAKTHRLLEADFSVGIWAIVHPDPAKARQILQAQARARAEGIDFRTKEFLGYYNGALYGQYKYPQACTSQSRQKVLCKTTELLIGPDGGIYRCHHDLYEGTGPIGHILDENFRMTDEYLPCDCFGYCNPCDIKVKTNRLQQFGHTSVSIMFEPQQAAIEKSPVAAAIE